MVSIEDIEKQLKENKLAGMYLLYGEETYLMDTVTKKIKSLFGELISGINYIAIDETNYAEIIPNLETPAFGFEKKMILCKNTGLLKKDGKKKDARLEEYREKIGQYIENNSTEINTTTVLLWIETDVNEKTLLYQAIAKVGIVCNVAEQKPIQLQKRVKAICNAYKVQIEDITLKYFVETCGSSMQELINEIRKLIEYVGENGAIQQKDVDLLCIKQIDSVIFDLTDNLGKRNIKASMQVLKELIYTKEPVQKIIITLYNHFKKLYLVSLSMKWNKDIVSSLNLKPNQTFLVGKYKMQAGYFKEQELRNIIQALIDLDYQYKSGLIDLNIGLESILCQYCS